MEGKRNAHLEVIDYVNEEALTNFVIKNVKEDSIVHTDLFGGYNGLNYAGFKHQRVNHNREFVRGKVHAQTIEEL